MDTATLMSLLVDLHRDGMRQGPGSDEESRRALELSRLDRAAPLEVADIGCGTGASALFLASALPNARLTVVDLFPEFLDVLRDRALEAGCSERILTIAESMDALRFAPSSLDLIWSEGAIYCMGFRKGLEAWRPFLKQGGVLAVSELTWLRPDPPAEIHSHWKSEYPEVATATEKIVAMESAGYDLLGYFPLPANCWLDHYHDPIERRVGSFLERHAFGQDAYRVVAMERHEADLVRRYQDWFSYGFYVARKRGVPLA